MKGSIGSKLINTYVIIIASTVLSGVFCLYVLGENLNTGKEIRNITEPTIERLGMMQQLMHQTKKLSSVWLYMANKKDGERLEHLVAERYKEVDKELDNVVAQWDNVADVALYKQIKAGNEILISGARRVMTLLDGAAAYVNDSLVDEATKALLQMDGMERENDRRYNALLQLQKAHLQTMQQKEAGLLSAVYLIVIASVLITTGVSYLSVKYARGRIVEPIKTIDEMMLTMSAGKVPAYAALERDDEIGHMSNALVKMASAIKRQIVFAEEIGKGNYHAEFELLSGEDKLGQALVQMRNDLRRQTTALLEQEQQLQQAQRLARIGNFYYDIRSGKFAVSATLKEILGVKLIGKEGTFNWKQYVSEEYYGKLTAAATLSIGKRDTLNETVKMRRMEAGDEIWVHVIGAFNYDEAGFPVSVFGTIQDVNERKELELELNKSYNITREQNNRLLNFSYIVSHNLRMHSVNIGGLLKLMEASETVEEREEYIGLLQVAADQLDETMQQLNDVVAMQHSLKDKLEHINLHDAVEHTKKLLTTQIAEKGAEIVNNVERQLTIAYNTVYLDSVLMNLLSNAVKYGHPERVPKVEVSCRQVQEGAHSMWVLEIKDNGLGIDLATNREKLFGMYKTFHGNKDAKGIGLFMSKYQVEAMGGNIEVESEVNKGTTFSVYIR